MIDYIAFDGQPSTKFGIRIEEYPVYAIAKRKVETYEVPGRSGSLVYDAGTYENVVQPYKVFYQPGPGVRLVLEGRREMEAVPFGRLLLRVLEDAAAENPHLELVSE